VESAAQVDAGFDPTIHDWQQRLLAGSAGENPA